MKYIKQLESSPRGIYCGAIGLLLPTEDDKMIFNIPIRTIEYKYGQAIYGVGAGITIDSKPKDEVNEFYAKTKILEDVIMQLFETMKIDNGHIPRLTYHTESHKMFF